MTLTNALTHPWLAGYNPDEVYGGRREVPVGLPPSSGVPDGDASMRSVMPADSMAMDAEPSQPSQPGPIPGSYPASQSVSGLVRRSDVILSNDDHIRILPPSQEMFARAKAEAAQYESTPIQTRPNKRKSAPLDSESSLTPMPEDREEQEEGENGAEQETNGVDEDESMATVETPRNGRPKRTKVAPRPPASKLARGRGGKTTGPPRSTRGKGARPGSDQDMATPPPMTRAPPPTSVSPPEGVRRSSRLTQSPQKAGRK